jgi:ABC-2 type transport system permease protein
MNPRPFYWSVRRELWENRFVYVAPLIVAAVVLFASLVGTFALPKKMRSLPTDPVKQAVVSKPFGMAPAPIMLATFLVGLFYSLDALHGERRDRSILFWKSLPVSDRTTVLSKAVIPLAVLPLIGFVLSVVTVSILMVWGTLVLAGSGMDPGRLWTGFSLYQEPVIMLYGLTVFALWWAPINGWLLLVSAWARRTPVLWATLPPLLIAAVERLTSQTTVVGQLLRHRFMGPMELAFTRSDGNIERLSQLAPLKFLSSSGLWGGLIFAALCLAAAVRLRRHREPI